jgi:predicted alpha/beta superfamily hydrolase
MADEWKRFGAIAAAALASAALAAPAAADPRPDHAAASGYTLPSTETWDIAADSGEIYRIFVSYPATEPPAEGWPVLYVLDGNAIFAGFAETRRMLEKQDPGKSIVVGVGYPTDKAYDLRRLYDLTAASPPPSPWREQFAQERRGGRDKFIDFLTGRLRTEVGKRYRINRDRQALFGHSLGGLLAVHALYSRPEAFHAIVAASPSLFWNEREMVQEERDFTARLQAGKIAKVSRLMVVAGEHEEVALERWDAEAFAKRMEPLSAHGLRTRSEVYKGEGHMTVPIRAVADTLRFAASWP